MATLKTACRHAQANLFHSCLQLVLGPITLYGKTGVAMVGGDGVWRRCHPIFACFVGDYPEQALATCTYCHGQTTVSDRVRGSRGSGISDEIYKDGF